MRQAAARRENAGYPNVIPTPSANRGNGNIFMSADWFFGFTD